MMEQPQFSDPQGNPLQYTATPPMNYDFTPQKNFSLISELSPKDELRNIMKELEGFLWDEKRQKYVIVEGVTPLLNQKGRNIFFHFATATINSIVTMSNYRKEVKLIHELALMQIRKAIAIFHFYWKDYGLSSKSEVLLISDKLLILTISSFYKALGAGDRSAATRNITENISRLLKPDTEPNQIPKRRGFFGGRTPQI